VSHFGWRWLPSFGHSGGILVGAKLDVFDIIAFDVGLFFASLVVCPRQLNCLWEIIVVYGLADHSFSQPFLDKLSSKIASVNLPLIVGGDFNLLLHPSDKNNNNFSWLQVEAFNDFIHNFALRELPRSGARFTWSNHQLNPVHCVLDMVFLCVLGGMTSTLALLSLLNLTLARITPPWCWTPATVLLGLLLVSILMPPGWRFRGFMTWSLPRSVVLLLRSLVHLALLMSGASSDGWANGYALEALLSGTHASEETYWKQCGHLNWILRGDSVSKYFFALANGTRRRC
jgi:hypothetical protein